MLAFLVLYKLNRHWMTEFYIYILKHILIYNWYEHYIVQSNDKCSNLQSDSIKKKIHIWLGNLKESFYFLNTLLTTFWLTSLVELGLNSLFTNVTMHSLHCVYIVWLFKGLTDSIEDSLIFLTQFDCTSFFCIRYCSLRASEQKQ